MLSFYRVASVIFFPRKSDVANKIHLRRSAESIVGACAGLRFIRQTARRLRQS